MFHLSNPKQTSKLKLDRSSEDLLSPARKYTHKKKDKHRLKFRRGWGGGGGALASTEEMLTRCPHFHTQSLFYYICSITFFVVGLLTLPLPS